MPLKEHPMSILGRLLNWCLFFLCAGAITPAALAQTALGTRIDNGLMAIDAIRTVPLPSQNGTWNVIFNGADPRTQSPAQLVGLVHSDPQSPIPMLVVRYSHRPNRWTGSVCRITSDSAFMTEYYDTQLSGNTHLCSALFPLASFKSFRNDTKSPIWQPVFQSGTNSLHLPDAPYMIASWRMQENGGQSLLIEALVRADLLGTSGSELLTSYRINQLNPAHKALSDWLRQVVLSTSESYFKAGKSTLSQLDTSTVLRNMQSAKPIERADFSTQPVIGTSTSLTLALDLPQSDAFDLPDSLHPDKWESPVNIKSNLITTTAAFSNTTTTAFELSSLEPIRVPADGTLIYKGMFEDQESGFVIDHGNGLYSLLASEMGWNLRTSPEPGSRVEQGQFLAGAATNGEKAFLTWDVFYSPQPITTSNGSELVQQLRSLQAMNTRMIANIGAVTFTVEGSRDDFSIAVDGQKLPHHINYPVIFLFEAGLVSLEVGTGSFFKTVNKDAMDLSSKGVLTQVIGKKANNSYAALRASLVTNDLTGTDEVISLLKRAQTPEITSTQTFALNNPADLAPPTAPVVPPASALLTASTSTNLMPEPVVDNSQAQRLIALANQREIELTNLRQQLARAEALRLQDAEKLAEIRAAEEKRQAEVLKQQIASQQQIQEAQRTASSESVVQQAKRKALVIGNDLYRNVPKLDNARADARAMGQSLESMGFQVTLAMDQTERALKETLRNFKTKVEGGDEVVVFYAGHGVQLGSTNYLLPIDIAGQNEDQVRDEAIQMQRILDDMQERRTGFMLMIVDACRDNPFKVAGRSIGGRGLAPTAAATGQMVIFSAGTGQQALDKLGANDKEPNGLFTRLFLREMKKPGISVDRVLRTVRSEVARLARSVGHEQTPALYDQSLGDFFFKPS